MLAINFEVDAKKKVTLSNATTAYSKKKLRLIKKKRLPCQMRQRQCRHRGWCVLCASNRFPLSEAAFAQTHCWLSMLKRKLLSICIWIKLRWNVLLKEFKTKINQNYSVFGMFFFSHLVVALGWQQRWKCPGCWGGTLGMNPESEKWKWKCLSENKSVSK